MPNGEAGAVLIGAGIAMFLFWIVLKLIVAAIDRDFANLVLNNGLIFAGVVTFFAGITMRDD